MPAAPSPTSASRTGGPRTCPSRKGQWNFDEIRFTYYRDRVAGLRGLQGRPARLLAREQRQGLGHRLRLRRGQARPRQEAAAADRRVAPMQAFAFNLRRPQFQDPRVRQAFNLAFDFEWANKQLFYDQYVRVSSYFDNSELKATGLAAGPRAGDPERGRGATCRPRSSPPSGRTRSTSRPKTARKHLAQAAKLLAEAGWKPKDGVLTTRDGVQLTAEFLLVQPDFERIVLPYKAALEKLGIKATCASSTPRSTSAASTPSTSTSSWRASPQSLSPGNEQRDFWGSEAADKEGSRNVIGIKNPAVDKLIDRSSSPRIAPSWSPPRARSTACCSGTTTSCRSGICPSSAWRIGTCSAGRTSCPRAAPSFLRVWWYDEAAAKRLADARGNERHARRQACGMTACRSCRPGVGCLPLAAGALPAGAARSRPPSRGTACPPSASSSIRPTSSISTTSIPTRPRAAASPPSAPARITTFDSFNSFILKGDAAQGLELLLRQPDGARLRRARCRLRPGRAHRPSVAADGMSVTFRLRPEAKFADGIADHRRRRRLLLQHPQGEGPPALPRRSCATSIKVEALDPLHRALHLQGHADARPAADRGRRCRSCPRPTTPRASSSRPRSSRRWARAPTRSATSSRAPSSPTSAATTTGPRTCRSTAAASTSTRSATSTSATAPPRSRASRPAPTTCARSSPRATGPPPTTSRPSRRAASCALTLPDEKPVRRAGLLPQHAPGQVRRSARAQGARLRLRLRVDQQEPLLRPLHAHRELLRELRHEGRRQAGARRSWRCSSRSATSCRRRCSSEPYTVRRSRTASRRRTAKPAARGRRKPARVRPAAERRRTASASTPRARC